MNPKDAGAVKRIAGNIAAGLITRGPTTISGDRCRKACALAIEMALRINDAVDQEVNPVSVSEAER